MDDEPHTRLHSLQQTRGRQLRDLQLADHVVRLEGLDRELTAQLERRWGGFLAPAGPGDPSLRLTVFSCGPEGWLPRSEEVENYRLELLAPRSGGSRTRIVASYHFAIAAEEGAADSWRLAVTDQTFEPVERVMDNALRFLAARIAVQAGGFALHAAGILRDDRAYFFAGPSNAGKTTATRLSGEVRSLGDDFAMIVPVDGRWCAPALPFDNSERAEENPPRGMHPVAAVWRLHKSPEIRMDRPPLSLAVASLMGCAAFPWAIPDLSEGLLRQVELFVSSGAFAHLHFRKDRELPLELFGSGGANC